MRGDKILARLIAPISDALDHPQVTDITINEPHKVWIRRAGTWETLTVPSFDLDTLDAMTILIGQRMGREFDEANPYVNSTLPGGQRFQGVRPPGTKPGKFLWAIRRPPTIARTIDDADFDDDGLFASTNIGVSLRRRSRADLTVHMRNRDWRSLFRAARMGGMSIGFCGAMGGGKSDLVRRVIQVYRGGVRMVIIETDDEMGDVGPPNKATLLYDDLRIPADEAVRIAKRLIPVEIVMQEVRGAEAFSLITALTSGCNGCATWHADQGKELEALCMMARAHPAGREMGDDLMTAARQAFDVIAYCERDDTGKFAVTNVRLMAAEGEMA